MNSCQCLAYKIGDDIYVTCYSTAYHTGQLYPATLSGFRNCCSMPPVPEKGEVTESVYRSRAKIRESALDHHTGRAWSAQHSQSQAASSSPPANDHRHVVWTTAVFGSATGTIFTKYLALFIILVWVTYKSSPGYNLSPWRKWWFIDTTCAICG